MKIEILKGREAKALWATLQAGERLVVVDGKPWGRTRWVRRANVTRHYLHQLKGIALVHSPYMLHVDDELPMRAQEAVREGWLVDPAVLDAQRKADAEHQRLLGEAARAERDAKEEALWAGRAAQAVIEFQRGTRLELAILDAMKWARSR